MNATIESRIKDIEREMAELREMVNVLRTDVNFLKSSAIGSFFGAFPESAQPPYHTVFGKNETKEEA